MKLFLIVKENMTIVHYVGGPFRLSTRDVFINNMSRKLNNHFYVKYLN